MILHLPPDSSPLVRAAADLVLVLHIGGGCVGIAAGTAALLLPKGAFWHRLAGNVFFVSMLVMAGIGAVVSPMLPAPSNSVGGVFALYLVLTGWLAARRKAGNIGGFEFGALFLALGTVAGGLYFGMQAVNSPTGLVDGLPPQPSFVLATFAALAAVLDMSVLVRGGVSGGQRVARHLWRLCAALFIADASLFLGQPKVFPADLRGAPIMFAPEILTLGVMVFWLVRLSRKRVVAPRPVFAHPRNTEAYSHAEPTVS
jgi:uncharacterized membrane protein